MISIAFKEWAVICGAFAKGRQSIILRKGGIAETDGEFRPEHDRFLLYPTFFHEKQRTGIKDDLMPLLDQVEAEKLPAGTIRISHFADVNTIVRITDLEQALALDSFHGWTPETVRQRFYYRKPGLFGLVVRVYQLPQFHEIAEHSEYTGCMSWVQLDDAISIDGATPTLDDAAFANLVESLSNLTTRR